ncbi:MAG TPA: hypothetical protein PLU65_07365, partial [Dokdonella sp.]|nr:hypothetical protein [Dokdonella sp.]
MESNKHALILTGELLAGFEAAAVWKAVAEHFRIESARLDSEVLARVPMTLKESDDLADLERRAAALLAMGAQCEVHPSSGGSYFVLLENVPRGPLPRSYIDQRIRSGAWPAGLKAAPPGSSEWRVLPPLAAGVPPAPLAAAAIPAAAESDTVAAKIARVADGIASRKEAVLPLPAGE